MQVVPTPEILKSQIATTYIMVKDYRADFWQILRMQRSEISLKLTVHVVLTPKILKSQLLTVEKDCRADFWEMSQVQRSVTSLKLTVQVVPTPARSKRILWDHWHNIQVAFAD